MGALRAPLGSETVHLCIDMQRMFTDDGPWPTPWMPRVLPTVERLVAHAPDRSIFTRFLTPRSRDDVPGMWRHFYTKWPMVLRDRIDPSHLELLPALQAYVPPAQVFDKPVYSAFATGALHRQLRDSKINTLIVTGSETDVCVLSSVLNAVDLGYRIVVVKDGLCSSSDDAHEASLHLYAQRFNVQIELAGADEILDAWRPG